MRCTVNGQEVMVLSGAYQHPNPPTISGVVVLDGFYPTQDTFVRALDSYALFANALRASMRRRKRRPTNARARAKRRMVTR